MKSKLYLKIGLPLFLFFICSCSNTARQFKQLEQQLSAAELRGINDFSPDSLLVTAWEEGKTLDQSINLLSDKIKNQKSDLPYFQLEQRLVTHLKLIDQFRTDASIYNLGGHLKVVLSQQNQSLPTKLLQCDSLLVLAPSYYTAAKTKLRAPNPERLSLAIRKQKLGLFFLNGALQDSIASLDQSAQMNWQKTTISAQRAMKDYLAWCNSQLIDFHSIENSLSDE